MDSRCKFIGGGKACINVAIAHYIKVNVILNQENVKKLPVDI